MAGCDVSSLVSRETEGAPATAEGSAYAVSRPVNSAVGVHLLHIPRPGLFLVARVSPRPCGAVSVAVSASLSVLQEQQQQPQQHRHALVSELFSLTGKAKLPGVCEYLSYLLQYNIKCLVFAHHLAVLDRLYQHITQTERKKAVQIDGRTPQDQREMRVRQFQKDPDCKVGPVLPLVSIYSSLLCPFVCFL